MYNREDFDGLKGLAFLARNGVRVDLVDADKFRVYGFYKSDSVEVDFETQTITARYNEVESIKDDWTDLVDRLLMLNKEWQLKSAQRHDSWKTMAPEWQRSLEAYNKATEP